MPERTLPRQAFHLHAPLHLEDTAEVESGDQGSSRQWSGTAYTGEALRLGPFEDDRLVIDLSTMRGLDQRLPALVGHDRSRIAGYAESIQAGESLQVSGRLLQSTEDGRTVAAASDEGFPWQLSIDARPARIEEVDSGEEVEVNGRQLTGPLVIFRDTAVREVSFTPTGVDGGTHAAALSDDPVTVHTEEAMKNGPKSDQGDNELATQLQELQQQLEQERQARQQAEAQLSEERQARRKGEVQALFAEIGREYSEDAARPYVQMDEDSWQAVAQDLRQNMPAATAANSGSSERPTPPDSATLQSEQAAGEPSSQQLSDEEVVSTLAKL